MGYTRDCEPLRVWSRLEPRARKDDFARVLRAEIHDPLWLLARQWQFGEFKGEDTGSPIFARMAVRTARIAAFRDRHGAPAAAPPPSMPLEARVEREPIPKDVAHRAQLGRQWLALLARHGADHDAGGGAPPFDLAAHRARYVARFPIAAPDAADPVARARHDANPRVRAMEAALAGRAIDGVAVAAAIPPGPIAWATLPAGLTDGVAPAHRAIMIKSLEELRAWIADVWIDPPDDGEVWDPAQLEYDFACEVPRPGGRATLRAAEYASGRLDWYSFDLGADAAPGPGDAHATEVRTVIPTLAEFPGQPSPRFWQLEDGAVDLGNLRADSTDLARVLVSQYALVYGNNWFVAPFAQAVGTLAEVEGLIVTDVFGQHSLVRPANAASRSWARWDLFSLDRSAATTSVGEHFFLAPAVHATLEGEPIETVRFVRDETSNLVWGVELRIPDGCGGSRDGLAAARAFTEALRRAVPDGPPPPVDPAARIRFVLGETVPENWIPFVPVHTGQDDRAVRLQRASMPRFTGGAAAPVRPRTRILRPGVTDDDRQTAPYYLHEEEVPRAGAQVDRSMQRARWLGGATAVWCGRRTRPGRGAGGAGLRFDWIAEVR